MPKIPTQQLQTGSMPSFEVARPAAQFRDFGAEQAADLGENILRFGAGAHRIGAEIQDDIDSAKIKKGALAAGVHRATTVSNFGKLKGQDAIAGYEAAVKALEKGYEGMADGWDNRIQSERVQQAIAAERAQALLQLDSHLAEQTQASNEGMTDATAQLRAEDAMKAAAEGRWDMVTLQTVAMRAQVEELGDLKGWGERGREAEVSSRTAKLQASIVALLADKPALLQGYVAHQGSGMNPLVAAKAQEYLDRAEDRQAGLDLSFLIQKEAAESPIATGGPQHILAPNVTPLARTPTLIEQQAWAQQRLDGLARDGKITAERYDYANRYLDQSYRQRRNDEAGLTVEAWNRAEAILSDETKTIGDIPTADVEVLRSAGKWDELKRLSSKLREKERDPDLEVTIAGMTKEEFEILPINEFKLMISHMPNSRRVWAMNKRAVVIGKGNTSEASWSLTMDDLQKRALRNSGLLTEKNEKASGVSEAMVSEQERRWNDEAVHIQNQPGVKKWGLEEWQKFYDEKTADFVESRVLSPGYANFVLNPFVWSYESEPSEKRPIQDVTDAEKRDFGVRIGSRFVPIVGDGAVPPDVAADLKASLARDGIPTTHANVAQYWAKLNFPATAEALRAKPMQRK